MYQDLDEDPEPLANPQKATNRAIRQLHSLGYSVIITQPMPDVASYSRMRSEGAPCAMANVMEKCAHD